MPESKVPITRDKAICEHAVASATCLLSGLDVFHPHFSSHDRALRVLKGLHGFHVYANEYWVDYVLYILSSDNSLIQFPELSIILLKLSNKLASLRRASLAPDEEKSALSDSRLDIIKGYPGLYESARIALEAQTQKKLGGVSGKEGCRPFNSLFSSSPTDISSQGLH